MKHSPGPRKTADLSKRLHRQLNMYSLAAGAAGATVLAVVQPAEAKIVYTKTNRVIGWNGVYPLDLNHDGIVDFLIMQSGQTYASSTGGNGVFAKEALGNAVQGSVQNETAWAAALAPRAPVGPGQDFVTSRNRGEIMANRWATHHSFGTSGQWVNISNRYLGLKFKIDGNTHFGWARLSVQLDEGFKMTATLTEYAYETVPNKGIKAGQKIGKGDATLAPTSTEVHGPNAGPSLGTLALGAQGIQPRRRP